MNIPKKDAPDQRLAAGEETQHFVWSTDKEKQLLFIEIKDNFSDYDLLNFVPRIWEENPEILWYDTVVDYRRLGIRNNWTWGAMKEVGRRWADFSQGCDTRSRVAVLTENYWLTEIVNNALAFVFPGSRFRCFKDLDMAIAWATGADEPD